MNRRLALAFATALAVGCAAIPTFGPPPSLPPTEGALERGNELYSSPRTSTRVKQSALQYEAAAQQSPSAAEALWKAARAYAWLGEYDTDPAEREAAIARGIAMARKAIAADAQRAEAHYYLAVNLGLFSGMKRVMNHLPEMAEAGEQAAQLDPAIDGAGPYRLLGSLYGQAPEPPVSIGDEERALDYLRKAIKLAPERAENYFRLAELLAGMGEKEEAKRHIEQALFIQEEEADPIETLAWQTQARTLWDKLK